MGEHFHERIIALAILALLIGFCFLVVKPFIVPTLWAIMLSVATWPAYVRLRDVLGGRAGLAATIMACAMLIVLVAPIALVAASLAEQVRGATRLIYDLTSYGLPPPPSWVAQIPLVGEFLDSQWRWAIANTSALLGQLRPFITSSASWLLARGADVGFAVIEFLVATVTAGILLAHGETTVGYLRRFVARIGDERRVHLVDVAGQTIRSVANGVVGTALVQSTLAAVALFVAGVPGTAILTLAVFMAALVQFPPTLIMILIGLWQYFQGDLAWALFIALWGILVVGTVDNFVRPYLISQGARLPFIVILVGVVGGLLAYGFIGIFVGATMIAVIWRMTIDWLRERPDEADPPAGGAPT
jgi:predicted PurR-regulated permease PerM